MSRLFKALPLALAMLALGIFAASCGSSSTQYRVVNGIAAPQENVDITLNGKSAFTNVAFGSTEPSSGYQKVSSGTDPIEVFQTGTTTNPWINSNLNLSSGNQYTVVLTGNSSANFAAQLLTDDNTAPTSGDAKFRIVDASLTTGGLDIYVLDPSLSPSSPGVAPINSSALTFPNATAYANVGLPTTPSLTVYVTVTGSTTPIAQQTYTSLNAGKSIRTIVLVDQSDGTYPPQLLELTDAD